MIFYNTVDIPHPKKIMLRHSPLFSASSSVGVSVDHASYYSIHSLIHPSYNPLFPRFPLSPPALGIPLQYNFRNSDSPHSLLMSKQYQSYLFCYLNNCVLDIHNSFNFQVPKFLLSWFPCWSVDSKLLTWYLTNAQVFIP